MHHNRSGITQPVLPTICKLLLYNNMCFHCTNNIICKFQIFNNICLHCTNISVVNPNKKTCIFFSLHIFIKNLSSNIEIFNISFISYYNMIFKISNISILSCNNIFALLEPSIIFVKVKYNTKISFFPHF